MTTFVDWGLIPYGRAYEQQRQLFEEAIRDKSEGRPVQNQFILCEHPHVITVGKHGLYSNLLFSEEILRAKGVELYQVDRGGDITYHGPEQVVGYPILNLEDYGLGLKEYIHQLEEVIIRTIAEYGIRGTRLEGATGVWLDVDLPTARKVAAIGVRSSRYVTMHGFALNINTDLSYFDLINPCGFTDKGVTSLQRELGRSVDVTEVKQKIGLHFRDILGE